MINVKDKEGGRIGVTEVLYLCLRKGVITSLNFLNRKVGA
jgi:hypothetical protein